MKTLKFTINQIPSIVNGDQTVTYRLFDDKQLAIDDELQLINSKTGKPFGFGRINEIISKRLGDLTDEDIKSDRMFSCIRDVKAELQQLYSSRLTSQTALKIVKFSFSKGSLAGKAVKSTTDLRRLKLYTDGGSRGNPGPSAGAFVLYDESDNLIAKEGLYLGIVTNNQAEYQALRLGLKRAEEIGAKVVHVYMDSLLVVNQMNGLYKIKEQKLLVVYKEICALTGIFDKVSFTHVPRQMNKLADEKLNQILDAQAKSS